MQSNGLLQVKTLGLGACLEQVKVPDQTIRLNRLNGFCHQEESDKKPLKNEIIIMTIAGMTMPDNRPYLPGYERPIPMIPDMQSDIELVRKTYKL